MSRIRRDGQEPEPEREPPREMLPAYRPFPMRLRPVSTPGDRCQEPGCTKTVAEHIAEFLRHGLRITERVVRL